MHDLIDGTKEFFERYRREIILGALLFLVSTTSFALGYLTARETNRAPIVIEKATSQ